MRRLTITLHYYETLGINSFLGETTFEPTTWYYVRLLVRPTFDQGQVVKQGPSVALQQEGCTVASCVWHYLGLAIRQGIALHKKQSLYKSSIKGVITKLTN